MPRLRLSVCPASVPIIVTCMLLARSMARAQTVDSATSQRAAHVGNVLRLTGDSVHITGRLLSVTPDSMMAACIV
jgi:hypothetical protein